MWEAFLIEEMDLRIRLPYEGCAVIRFEPRQGRACWNL